MAKLTDCYNTTYGKLNLTNIELELRPYLGMSQIGHECARYLWYQFRWAYKDSTTNRMIRLWNRGHNMEKVLTQALNDIDVEVYGDQEEMIDGLGHVRGHNDGRCINVPEAPKTEHLLEFKTVKGSGFKQLKKAKLEKYSSTYWGQTQLYMHYLKLTRCLFLAICKETDEIYVERIRYNKGEAEDLIRKASSIILSPHPLPRAYPSKTFYKCKWCAASEQCWNGKPLEEGCRTCAHSEIAPEGKWLCTKPTEPATIPVAVQRVGCPYYTTMEL